MTDLTDAEIEEIRERCERATPGPWHLNPTTLTEVFMGDGEEGADFYWIDYEKAVANAKFTAHARTDIRRLLTALEEARAERDRLREALEEVHEELHDGAQAALNNGRDMMALGLMDIVHRIRRALNPDKEGEDE